MSNERDIDGTRRRKARAAWAYSQRKQDDFADDAGITYDRLRGLIGATLRGPAPTLDELHQMADAAGLDRAFMADDFGRGEQVGVSDLREALAELLAVTARHTQELEELRAWRRRQGPSATGEPRGR